MTLKKILASMVIALGCGQSIANADTLGLEVGGGIWQAEPSGTIRNQGTDLDLKDDMHFKQEDQNYVYAVFEHPIPLIPNIKVSQTSLAFSGSGASNFSYGGSTYTANVTTKMVLDHSDVTLYYRLLDNIVNFDLGVTAKTFNGKVEIDDGSTFTSSKIEGTIPMVYAAVGVDIPLTGLFVGVEGNMLSVNNSTIKDVSAKIAYTTSYFVGFEVGVRTLTVELDNQNSNYSNMKFTGTYANMYLHF